MARSSKIGSFWAAPRPSLRVCRRQEVIAISKRYLGWRAPGGQCFTSAGKTTVEPRCAVDAADARNDRHPKGLGGVGRGPRGFRGGGASRNIAGLAVRERRAGRALAAASGAKRRYGKAERSRVWVGPKAGLPLFDAGLLAWNAEKRVARPLHRRSDSAIGRSESRNTRKVDYRGAVTPGRDVDMVLEADETTVSALRQRERRARRRRSRQVTCATCYTVFVPTRQDTQFCTPGCRQKHYRHQKAVRAAVRERVANLVASLIG